MLSEDGKSSRRKIALNLLYSEEGKEKLQRIVAIDEIWIRAYEPELKRQSSEWHNLNSPS